MEKVIRRLIWTIIPLTAIAIFLISLGIVANNMITAISQILMAVTTLVLAVVTYTSYNKLVSISTSPALSVILWKHLYAVGGSYGVTIRNDGPAIAKEVRLWINWAKTKTPDKEGEWVECKFSKEDLSGVYGFDIGNIGPRDSEDFDLTLPKLPSNEEVYGVKLTATCKDIFEEDHPVYHDTKTVRLSNAKIKPLLLPK